MHNSFYASGFLYSPKLHQILLLKSPKKDSTDFIWSTLGGEGSKGEDFSAAFQRIIGRLLNLSLKPKDIYPVYDYFHDLQGKVNYVFYAQVRSSREFNILPEGSFEWVAFHEISKLLFTSHSKQDVIVGERVINAKWRDDEAKKLPQIINI